MHVLITGFEPFGGETVNPSAQVLDLLPSRAGGYEVRTLLLPVSWDESFEVLRPHLDDRNLAAVILTGQAGGRAELTLEVIAVNVRYSVKPDNKGQCKGFERLVGDAPDGLFCTWPLTTALEALERGGPARPSFSAGAYLCNELYFKVLWYLQGRLPCCFVHLPYTDEQVSRKEAGTPWMPLSMALQGLKALVDLFVRQSFGASGGI